MTYTVYTNTESKFIYIYICFNINVNNIYYFLNQTSDIIKIFNTIIII